MYNISGGIMLQEVYDNHSNPKSQADQKKDSPSSTSSQNKLSNPSNYEFSHDFNITGRRPNMVDFIINHPLEYI
jgi:hypothetical protein